MILETATQRDDDWHAARCGKATASRFKDVMARLKNGVAAGSAPRLVLQNFNRAVPL